MARVNVFPNYTAISIYLSRTYVHVPDVFFVVFQPEVWELSAGGPAGRGAEVCHHVGTPLPLLPLHFPHQRSSRPDLSAPYLVFCYRDVSHWQ